MSLRLLGVTVVLITCVLCLLLKCLSSKYLPYENSVTAKTSSDIHIYALLYTNKFTYGVYLSLYIVGIFYCFSPQHVRFREQKESDDPSAAPSDDGNSESACQSYADTSTEDSSVLSWGYDVSRTASSKPNLAH